MRTKRSQELAFKVCDYYVKIAHGNRKLTFKHFKKEGVPRSTLHGILSKYDETGTATYAKIKGRPPRVMTPQMIKEVARAYQVEPSVSNRTLAKRLNIPPSTLQEIKMRVAKSNLQKYEDAQAQIVNSANDSNLGTGSPESCQGRPGCHSPKDNCTICCQNIENCVNLQESDNSTTTSVISQTICKLFGIQDDFESLSLASTYCANCSSLILKIQKFWQDLDEAKLQLEEIIIKNADGAAGSIILVQNPTEIARNEIIKRTGIYINPEVAVKSEDNRKDLNEAFNNDLPDWNLYEQDNYIENADETQEEYSNVGLDHNETGEFSFSLKNPVLKLTKLPQRLVKQLTLKNVHPKVIQNGINLHLKKDQENRIINKSTISSKDNSISGKKERSHLCHLCSQTFTYPFHLRKHLKSHSRKNIMCPMADCVKTFESNDDLQDHLNIHNDTKVHKCPEDHCDSLYYTKKQLAAHLTLHGKLKGKFECSLCPCSFGFAKNLLSHKKSVHNYTESTELMCEICAKVFPSKLKYSKHKYKAHKSSGKYNINEVRKQCPICRCWFKNDLFERHKNIHRQLALTDHIFSTDIETKA